MNKHICCRPARLGKAVMGGEKYLLCVPVTGHTNGEILEEVCKAAALQADMIEWRIDEWEHYPDADKAAALLGEISKAAGGMGILVTPRSKRERDPGAEDISDEAKFGLIDTLSATGLAHAFDVEYFYGEEVLRRQAALLHGRGCCLLIALHTSPGVYSDEALLHILQNMQDWGGDIAKLCVRNERFGDFVHFAGLLLRAREEFMDIPMVSAADMSGISRALGDAFGTDMIFVTTDGSRQPGIQDLRILRSMLWPDTAV